MAPDIEHCETVRLNEEQAVPVHHGRRILPDGQPPASAWVETEDERPGDHTGSPGENKRLLPSGPPARHKSRLQAGLTLGVHPPVKYKYPPLTKSEKTVLKTKSDKKKSERKVSNLIALLKPPYFIVSMIIVNVLIHESIKDADVRALLQWNPDGWWRQPWRLVTYGCVHASHLHLALNSLVALAVGWPLEREQGWWRVVVLWLGGLAAGALGAGLLQDRVRVVGASAAVYALLTAHISNVCLRHGHISLWWFRPLSVLVLGTSEVCWALVRSPAPARAPHAGEHLHSPYEYVAWAAHILGAVVGVPLAFVVFTGENNKKRYVVACRVVSAALLVAGVVVAAVCYAHAAEPGDYDMT